MKGRQGLANKIEFAQLWTDFKRQSFPTATLTLLSKTIQERADLSLVLTYPVPQRNFRDKIYIFAHHKKTINVGKGPETGTYVPRNPLARQMF